MAKEFKLPDLGSGLKEGEIVSWLVKVGDTVTTDDLLCEVETEKAVIEVPVPYDGKVLSLAVEAGESVKVGSVLAVFGSEDETAPKTPEAASGVTETRQPDPVPVAATIAESVASTGPLRAMPAVRRLASEHAIDITSVNGTGRDGRVTKKDVLAWLKQPQEAPQAASTSIAVAPVSTVVTEGSERVKLSKLRKTIADRMAASWREIPHIFTRIEVDASGFLRARSSLSDVYGAKVPVESLLIRAVLPALQALPEFNATLDNDDELVLHRHYNISLAVDTDQGLVLPTVRNADQHSMAQLAAHVSDLLPRAVQRKASAEELTGGTFTVNNIGALGNIIGTSIIPYGTTAILSVGRAMEKPVVRNGDVVVLPMMEVTLSFDHRVIDGGLAQKFLAIVQRNLEDAVRLLA